MTPQNDPTISRRIKHGHAPDKKTSRTYRSWDGMLQRCLNPKHQNYPRYGARGITVCERWRKFVNFLEDMGERPEKLELERLDNGKGYEKSNCVWASRKQQMNNTRNNRLIVWNDRQYTLQQLCEEIGMERMTLYNRLNRGMSLELAVSKPLVIVRKRARRG